MTDYDPFGPIFHKFFKKKHILLRSPTSIFLFCWDSEPQIVDVPFPTLFSSLLLADTAISQSFSNNFPTFNFLFNLKRPKKAIFLSIKTNIPNLSISTINWSCFQASLPITYNLLNPFYYIDFAWDTTNKKIFWYVAELKPFYKKRGLKTIQITRFWFIF